MNLSRPLRVALTLVATAVAALLPLVGGLPHGVEAVAQGVLLALAALGIVPVHLDVEPTKETK